MVWFKWVANAHRDAEISALTDTQFRAFITIIGEVKLLRSGGIFKNRQHLKTVIGARLFRGVDGLLKSGLLTESGDGVIAVSNYSRYQVDPTSTSRGQKWRDQNRGRLTDREREGEGEKNRTPISPKRSGSGRLTPLNEILGLKKNA
jgi:hypothetical protein|tara:strand:- start:186 stop:626 length:441 start_codon:yes stop_codon:yes gene_type:complete